MRPTRMYPSFVPWQTQLPAKHGNEGSRTRNFLLAKEALSQLSYVPKAALGPVFPVIPKTSLPQIRENPRQQCCRGLRPTDLATYILPQSD